MPLSFRQAGSLFVAGPNIGIYPSGNTFAISGSASGSTVGIESISTLGSGTFSIASSVTNNNLVYRTLSGTSSFGIAELTGTLIFTASTPSSSGIISGTNIGTGTGVFFGLTTTDNPNDTLAFYNLSGGNEVGLFINDNDEIEVSRGRNVVNTVSNQGGGAKVYTGITGSSLVVRTISGVAGFTSALGNTVNAETDSDATAFITAASITSTTQITAISNLVFDLKQNNLWNKMLAVYPFVGGTENSHKYNLKDPRDVDAAFRLSFTTGWTHNASGATSNGTSAYANTFLTPSTALTNNNTHLSVYPRLNTVGSSAGMIGTASGASFIPLITIYQAQSGGQQIFDAYNYLSSAGRIQITNPNYRGHLINSRISNTDFKAYSKGILTGSNLNTSTDNVRNIPFSIFIGGLNLNGTPGQYSSNQFAFASIGSGLTASEASTFSTIVEAYQTTLGRQVFASTNRGVNTVVNIAPTNTTANRFYIEDSTGVLTTNADFPIDATNGNISIDVAVSTTSRLLLPSGTAAVSQIRLTPFSTEPSSPTNGDIWFNTSGDLKFQKNTTTTDFIFEDNNNSLVGTASSLLSTDSGGTITPKYINTFGVFNALSSVTISDTTTETSIISSLLTGTTTLLASNNSYNPQLVTGRKYRFNAKGTIDTGDNVNLTIRVKLGSITISSSSTISVGLEGSAYSSEIEIDTTFTVRSSGLIVGSGKIMFLTEPSSGFGGAGEQVIFGIASRKQTITTTANQVFDCTAQFGTADPSNIITINESTLEFLN